MSYCENRRDRKLKEEKKEIAKQLKYRDMLEKDKMPTYIGLQLIMNIIDGK